MRSQAIVNHAIEHLVTNVLRLLKISEFESIQAQMAVGDREKNRVVELATLVSVGSYLTRRSAGCLKLKIHLAFPD